MPTCMGQQLATRWLADTELFIEVEKDLTSYGDEVKFGEEKLLEMGWDNLKYLAPKAQ